VETNLEDGLPEMYCNESDLREALTNLVLNSVDALPQGGWIKLSARRASVGTLPGQTQEATHVILEVTDNGIGMDEKTRQRCLEPFFSTKQQRGGSGLGLAMVYGTVERHEGRIEIMSAVNKGTTVQLILPLRRPPTPKEAAPAAASPVPASLRILCIDDEPLLREMLKEILEFYQHRVETADGGEAGLELFHQARAQGRPFELVITDLGMPGVNGRQVAEKIKSESPGTAVVMLTGWGTMLEDKGEGVAKVDAVLSKPPRVNELLETVAKVTGVALATETAFVTRRPLEAVC
jgi:CheY-like chemotaxis protein/anti-sigma regulatory factor (Ser/Thr protein kinase)